MTGGTRVPGTVRTHDPGTGAGIVVLDDGRELAYSSGAFAVSRLRLLRPGQRVELHRVGDDVIAVTLPGETP